VALQKKLGAKDLAALRALPAERFVGESVGPPHIDGWFMPRSPMAIFAEGRQNDAGAFVGFTRDEGYGPFITVATPAEYEAAAKRLYGADAGKLLALYPANADFKLQAQLASRDITLGAAMRRWAMGQARPGRQPAYAYMFSRVHPVLPGAVDPAKPPVASHASDVVYWLGNLDALNRPGPTRGWTDWDRKLSDVMTDMVVAFAKTGDPSTPAAAVPRYDPRDEKVIELGDTIRVIPWPAREHVDVLHALKAAD
jgi:para-nitrobenzyl esterase